MGFSSGVMGGDIGFYRPKSAGGAPPSLSFDFTTGTLPGAITFTRASIGTYTNNVGILTTASANAARFNYVGGVACLLVEPAATNLLVQSNNFSAADWVPGFNPVIAAAQFTSPDGTNNGWSMTGGDGNAYIYQLQTGLTAIPYTMSMWLKQIAGAGQFQATIGGASAVVIINATLTRYSGTKTSAAGGPTAIIQVLGVAGDKNGMYGVQLETGSVMTSYIPTTSAVTRAADSAVFTIPAGIGHLTYTFDDNSTQLVTVSAGSYTIPTNLNRPNLKSIVGSA